MADLPDTSGIEPHYTDAEVARMLDPTGKRIKPSSIRYERKKGRLVGTRVAGIWLYRKSDVEKYLHAARVVIKPEPRDT